MNLKLKFPKLSPPSLKEEALVSMWIFFLASSFMLLAAGLAMRELHARQQRLDLDLAALAASHTHLETQFGACSGGLQEWNRWLQIRAEGWGTAWYLRPEEKEIAP